MSNDSEERALANLRSALDRDIQLPANVFLGCWDGYFFFDDRRIFTSEFVEVFRAMLDAEGASTVCIYNLDAAIQQRDDLAIFLNSAVGGDIFMAMLGVSKVGSGWLYRMENFACSSEVGHWCIYWESQCEFAVIAIRPGWRVRFKPVLETLKALPIDQALKNPPSFGLSRFLKSEWRERLLEEYAEPAR